MFRARLTAGAWALVLVALFGTCIGEASCSGKNGTCEAADCGAVGPVFLGFTCEEYGLPPYAAIVQTTVTGPCTSACREPRSTGGCWEMEIDPTGPGTCAVSVTSSTGAVFPLTYTWVALPVSVAGHVCPGCFTFDFADGGGGSNPFARDCEGGAGESGDEGGASGG